MRIKFSLLFIAVSCTVWFTSIADVNDSLELERQVFCSYGPASLALDQTIRHLTLSVVENKACVTPPMTQVILVEELSKKEPSATDISYVDTNPAPSAVGSRVPVRFIFNNVTFNGIESQLLFQSTSNSDDELLDDILSNLSEEFLSEMQTSVSITNLKEFYGSYDSIRKPDSPLKWQPETRERFTNYIKAKLNEHLPRPLTVLLDSCHFVSGAAVQFKGIIPVGSHISISNSSFRANFQQMSELQVLSLPEGSFIRAFLTILSATMIEVYLIAANNTVTFLRAPPTSPKSEYFNSFGADGFAFVHIATTLLLRSTVLIYNMTMYTEGFAPDDEAFYHPNKTVLESFVADFNVSATVMPLLRTFRSVQTDQTVSVVHLYSVHFEEFTRLEVTVVNITMNGASVAVPATDEMWLAPLNASLALGKITLEELRDSNPSAIPRNCYVLDVPTTVATYVVNTMFFFISMHSSISITNSLVVMAGKKTYGGQYLHNFSAMPIGELRFAINRIEGAFGQVSAQSEMSHCETQLRTEIQSFSDTMSNDDVVNTTLLQRLLKSRFLQSSFKPYSQFSPTFSMAILLMHCVSNDANLNKSVSIVVRESQILETGMLKEIFAVKILGWVEFHFNCSLVVSHVDIFADNGVAQNPTIAALMMTSSVLIGPRSRIIIQSINLSFRNFRVIAILAVVNIFTARGTLTLFSSTVSVLNSSITVSAVDVVEGIPIAISAMAIFTIHAENSTAIVSSFFANVISLSDVFVLYMTGTSLSASLNGSAVDVTNAIIIHWSLRAGFNQNRISAAHIKPKMLLTGKSEFVIRNIKMNGTSVDTQVCICEFSLSILSLLQGSTLIIQHSSIDLQVSGSFLTHSVLSLVSANLNISSGSALILSNIDFKLKFQIHQQEKFAAYASVLSIKRGQLVLLENARISIETSTVECSSAPLSMNLTVSSIFALIAFSEMESWAAQLYDSSQIRVSNSRIRLVAEFTRLASLGIIVSEASVVVFGGSIVVSDSTILLQVEGRQIAGPANSQIFVSLFVYYPTTVQNALTTPAFALEAPMALILRNVTIDFQIPNALVVASTSSMAPTVSTTSIENKRKFLAADGSHSICNVTINGEALAALSDIPFAPWLKNNAIDLFHIPSSRLVIDSNDQTRNDIFLLNRIFQPCQISSTYSASLTGSTTVAVRRSATSTRSLKPSRSYSKAATDSYRLTHTVSTDILCGDISVILRLWSEEFLPQQKSEARWQRITESDLVRGVGLLVDLTSELKKLTESWVAAREGHALLRPAVGRPAARTWDTFGVSGVMKSRSPTTPALLNRNQSVHINIGPLASYDVYASEVWDLYVPATMFMPGPCVTELSRNLTTMRGAAFIDPPATGNATESVYLYLGTVEVSPGTLKPLHQVANVVGPASNGLAVVVGLIASTFVSAAPHVQALGVYSRMVGCHSPKISSLFSSQWFLSPVQLNSVFGDDEAGEMLAVLAGNFGLVVTVALSQLVIALAFRICKPNRKVLLFSEVRFPSIALSALLSTQTGSVFAFARLMRLAQDDEGNSNYLPIAVLGLIYAAVVPTVMFFVAWWWAPRGFLVFDLQHRVVAKQISPWLLLCMPVGAVFPASTGLSAGAFLTSFRRSSHFWAVSPVWVSTVVGLSGLASDDNGSCLALGSTIGAALLIIALVTLLRMPGRQFALTVAESLSTLALALMFGLTVLWRQLAYPPQELPYKGTNNWADMVATVLGFFVIGLVLVHSIVTLLSFFVERRVVGLGAPTYILWYQRSNGNFRCERQTDLCRVEGDKEVLLMMTEQADHQPFDNLQHATFLSEYRLDPHVSDSE